MSTSFSFQPTSNMLKILAVLVLAVFVLLQLKVPSSTIATITKASKGEVLITTLSRAKCLTFKETLDNLIASSKQVFISMPAKGSGTSLKQFTTDCAGDFSGGNPNLLINHPYKIEEIFLRKYKLQRLITAHTYKDKALIRIIRNIPHSSLIIYMHRDETNRFISSIKQVTSSLCAGDLRGSNHTNDQVKYYTNSTSCVLSEKDLIDKIIKPRHREVGFGEPEIISCNLYNAIQENYPQFVFIHYKQANKLQKALAKYFCPNFLLNTKEIQINTAKDKKNGSVFKIRGE